MPKHTAAATVRIAHRGDVGRVAPLFDLYRQFYEQAPDLDAARQFLDDRFARGESVLLVAESDAQCVGFCQLYPSFCSVIAAPIYVLYDIFVHPDARRHHIGRDLLLAAEAHARASGFARMDLTTAHTNRTAQTLYESLGWKRDEVFLTYNRFLR